MGGNSQLVGLYIPYEIQQDFPRPVSGLDVLANPEGKLSATLSWTNPTKFVNGNNITDLDRIEIYRNGLLVHTLSSPRPGQESSYTDIVDSAGLYAYRVIAYGDEKGFPSTRSLFIGQDVPAAPQDIRLQSSGLEAHLSWEAVTTGLHDGYIDASQLSYRITRHPGNVDLGITTQTSYQDQEISEMQAYSYSVQSLNPQGEGGTGISNTLVIGPAFEPPFSCGFTEEQTALWTILDRNQDGYSWVRDATLGYPVLTLRPAAYGSLSDDHAFCPAIRLQAGQTYRISLALNSMFAGGADTLCLGIGTEARPESQTRIARFYGEQISTQEKTAIVEYTPSSTEEYRLGLSCLGQGGSYLKISNVDVRAYRDNDLVALSLDGPARPIAGKAGNYTFRYKNMGKNTASGFNIQLLDQDGNILASFDNHPDLEPEASDTLHFEYTPQSPQEASALQCRIEYAQDEEPGSNVSNLFEVDIQPAGSADLIQIGVNGSTAASISPIVTSYLYAGTQSLYAKEEMQSSHGLIESIAYYLAASEGAKNVEIEIWMANTDARSLASTGMLPKELFTKVYHHKLDIPATTTTLPLEFELDQDFLYLGESLCIMVAVKNDKLANTSFLGYTDYVISPLRFSMYTSNETPFNYASEYVYLSIPQVDILIQQNEGSSLSGSVKDMENKALPGANIRMENLSNLANGQDISALSLSDTNGNYVFPYLLEGNYRLTAEKFGYKDVEQEVSLGQKEQKNLNINMEALGTCTVEGYVHDGKGQAVADAEVKLDGYASYQTSTGTDGRFSIPDVFVTEENYTLEIKKLRFQTYTDSLRMDENLTDLDIRLSGISHAPSTVTAQVQGDSVVLAWEGVETNTLFRYDDGKACGQIGPSTPDPYHLIGTTFPCPMILKEISWFITRQESLAQDSVNIFVFGLDQEGKPDADQILLQLEAVPSQAGEWSNHCLESPLTCPDGCFIALSSKNFLSLGLDSGEDEEWPFRENTHYTIYLFSPFQTLESSAGIRQNPMIRALGEQAGSPRKNSKEIVKGQYNVYRLRQGQQTQETEWTLLNSKTLQQPGFTDKGWKDLESGVYLYAVKALSETEDWSEATFSNTLDKDMNCEIRFELNTNTKDPASQAEVSLRDIEETMGHDYTLETDNNGIVVFPDVRKGTYVVGILLDGFHGIHDTLEIKEASTFEYRLEERLTSPYNLTATVEGNAATLSWNTPWELQEGFENYEAFSINPAGEPGWSYLDMDQAGTVVMGPASYPNVGKPMAAMVFNPSATTPALSMFEIQPYEGKQYLGFFASVGKANNDWFISPELESVTPLDFSFHAKTMTPTAAMERMRVGYSMTGKDTGDFIWLHEEPYVEPPYMEWTRYAYEIPVDAKYVAINCISQDGFLLMVDAIELGMAREENLRPSTRYEVYLDGELHTTLQGTTSYRFENLAQGTYRTGVKAVYETGESKITETEFRIGPSGNQKPGTADFRIWPNPVSQTLYMEGDAERIEILNLLGWTVLARESGNTNRWEIPVQQLSAGCYLLRITQNGQSRIVKFIKQ